MPIQQQWLAGLDGDRLEQTITVGQATIFERQSVSRLTVDPALHQPANRRNTREPLVPPNPNELDSTTSISMSRAVCGTKSRSQPSSGSSRLMVGGATCPLIASTLKIASTAPAAPSRCPVMDLVEL